MVDYSPEAGRAALDRLLGLARRPTAVFAGSDIQAISVLETARRAGLRVPEDLSVVGYNDIEVSRYLRPDHGARPHARDGPARGGAVAGDA